VTGVPVLYGPADEYVIAAIGAMVSGNTTISIPTNTLPVLGICGCATPVKRVVRVPPYETTLNTVVSISKVSTK
jgi:hypothetical protein